MAVLHGTDCNNEVIEFLFLGTVMQLYSCLAKWVNIHKMCLHNVWICVVKME